MRDIVKSSSALFLGIACMMLGSGLQGSLLGVRASIEGFSTAATGLVMSAYYVGFLAGSVLAPNVIREVGHIRVFAALASLASASTLLVALFVDPIAWFIIRLVTGFCYAGLYVVAESWLNDRATNETRGQLLSVYMVTILGGLACGQLLLNVADPAGTKLFILVSVLLSLALVPISLTARPAPNFGTSAHVGLRTLYKISPLGVLGCLAVGMAHGSLLGMGAVYAGEAGLSVGQISIFMAVAILGGMAFQWPIGRASDKLDRRRVIMTVAFLASVAAIATIPLPNSATVWLFALMCLLGGFSFPLYSLCLAYTNDYLEPEQMVAASSSLVLVGGVGASLGPLTVASVMSVIGPDGFFWYLAAVHGVIGAFALYRMTQRDAKPVDEQGTCVVVASRASPVASSIALQTIRDQMDTDLSRMTGR